MITGSLQVKNDTYYAVLNLYVDGRRRPKWISTNLPVRGNKRKAESVLNELINEYETNIAFSTGSAGADQMFLNYLYSWLENARSSIAIMTYQSYHSMIKGRIEKYFRPKKITLGQLTAQQLEEFYRSILSDDCTTNTVIHYHAIIRRALQTAVRKDIIPQNPADKLDRPRKNSYTASFYSVEEMQTLFDAVSGDPIELCVKLAAYYGLRRSEVLGLRWEAINFKEKLISIQHKVIEYENDDGKTVLLGEDTLKTKSSHRTLPLLPEVEKLLLAEAEKQKMYRRLFKKSYCTDYLDYICVDQLGKLLYPNYLTEHFTWVIEKYGLRKLRFHDLRHTCASLLLANKVSMKQIQLWLGHSTFATTADIYAHLDYSAQVETGAVMNSMYGKPEADPKA